MVKDIKRPLPRHDDLVSELIQCDDLLERVLVAPTRQIYYINPVLTEAQREMRAELMQRDDLLERVRTASAHN